MINRLMRAMLLVATSAIFCALPARAHPHVWVTYETTIVYDKGAIVALDHVWTFDDMYTAMAIEGLDTNKDGKYDRQELSELAKVNMEGLKEFDYFTYARLGKSDLKFGPPQDPWLEYTNGVLHLHFRLPLSQPVLAEAQGFSFSVYDPSYFIAFDPEATDPVKLSGGAPKGCKATLADPKTDQNAADVKKLGQAFAQQLGGAAAFGMAKSVVVSCKSS